MKFLTLVQLVTVAAIPSIAYAASLKERGSVRGCASPGEPCYNIGSKDECCQGAGVSSRERLCIQADQRSDGKCMFYKPARRDLNYRDDDEMHDLLDHIEAEAEATDDPKLKLALRENAHALVAPYHDGTHTTANPRLLRRNSICPSITKSCNPEKPDEACGGGVKNFFNRFCSICRPNIHLCRANDNDIKR